MLSNEAMMSTDESVIVTIEILPSCLTLWAHLRRDRTVE